MNMGQFSFILFLDFCIFAVTKLQSAKKMVIVGNIFQLKLGLIETNVSSDENALNLLSFPHKLTFVENQICSLKSSDVRKTVIFKFC